MGFGGRWRSERWRRIPLVIRVTLGQDAGADDFCDARNWGFDIRLRQAVGDHVDAGDLIARLDNETVKGQLAVQQSQVEEGMAELEALQAEMLLAEQDMKRQNNLKKSGAFSRAKHEDAIQNVAKAKPASWGIATTPAAPKSQAQSPPSPAASAP